jgi:hypothetical protein
MKKWIGLAMIGIMFFSVPAYAFFQGSFTTQVPETNQQTQLPLDYIIDYKMTQDQYYHAIENGFAVATYRYSLGCAECGAERSLLEQIVMSREFQGQIILEEVQESGSPKLEIASFAGEKSFDKIEKDAVAAALCELVVNPPLGCVKAPGT